MRISDWSSDVCSSDLAGVTILGAPSTVVNSGTISGAGAGITTAYYFNPTTGLVEGRAAGTTVENSGTLAGESNDGVRLIGGGSGPNSGTLSRTRRAEDRLRAVEGIGGSGRVEPRCR